VRDITGSSSKEHKKGKKRREKQASDSTGTSS